MTDFKRSWGFKTIFAKIPTLFHLSSAVSKSESRSPGSKKEYRRRGQPKEEQTTIENTLIEQTFLISSGIFYNVFQRIIIRFLCLLFGRDAGTSNRRNLLLMKMIFYIIWLLFNEIVSRNSIIYEKIYVTIRLWIFWTGLNNITFILNNVS